MCQYSTQDTAKAKCVLCFAPGMFALGIFFNNHTRPKETVKCYIILIYWICVNLVKRRVHGMDGERDKKRAGTEKIFFSS